MKNSLLLLLVLICGAASTADAATLYNKPNKDNVLPDPPAQSPSVQVPQSQIPATPPASTEPAPTGHLTIDEFSKNYYQNCLKQEHPIMKGEPLRMLCECTSERVKQVMTIEEVVTMTTDTPAGQAQRNRMAVYVYAPCMEFPTRALLYHNCASNKAVLEKYSAKGNELCTCMADDMAKYISDNGPGEMARVLTSDPNNMDPLSGLLSSPEFQSRTEAKFIECVSKHGAMPKTP